MTAYVSPQVAAGAASTRRPEDVLFARRAASCRAPIRRFYLIEVSGREGTYLTESGYLPRGLDHTEAQGLSALKNEDDAVAVWEVNPSEGGLRNVSEDMARLWLAELLADRSNEFDPADAATWPGFLSIHLTNDEACQLAQEAA